MKVLITFLIIIIGLLGFYIFQVNAKISERFLVQEYEQKLNNLSQENKILEISFAQDGSLGRIIQMAEELNFEKTDKIHYIRALDTQVVVYE